MRRAIAVGLVLALLVVPFDLALAAFGGGLPVDAMWLGGCPIGVGRNAILHGSQVDTNVTWATDVRSGRRFELLWPAGYRAGFNPKLELRNRQGRVVGHEGDLIIGSCTMRPSDRVIWRVEESDVRPPTWEAGDG
jgi:hypothetical protein